MKINKYFFVCISLLLTIFCNYFFMNYNCYAKNIEKIDNTFTTAKSMVVIETQNNSILYSKNKDEKLPMASTTKIATCITVIDNCSDLDKLVTIPKCATLVEGSSIYLREGEQLTVRQLLYGLMLRSGNDAALTLALEIGNGSVEEFAKLMNKTAIKCGAKNTNFVTPHGLDDKNHYTTAYDLALITSYALRNETFKQISSTKCYKVPATEHNTARTFVNKNKLLSSLENCIGVKTGYTSKSGRCLVSACEKDNMQIVCVVLNCRPMFEESAELLNQAFKEYCYYEILPSYKFVDDVAIEDGEKSTIRLYNKNGYSVICKENEKENYKVVYDYKKDVKAPISKDEIMGTVKVYYNNNLIFSENLCSIESVKSISNSDKLKEILDKW